MYSLRFKLLFLLHDTLSDLIEKHTHTHTNTSDMYKLSYINIKLTVRLIRYGTDP